MYTFLYKLSSIALLRFHPGLNSLGAKETFKYLVYPAANQNLRSYNSDVYAHSLPQWDRGPMACPTGGENLQWKKGGNTREGYDTIIFRKEERKGPRLFAWFQSSDGRYWVNNSQNGIVKRLC